MVRATGDVPTTLLGVMGVHQIDIGVEAIAAIGSAPLEIAFVVDATNSMLRGSRWRTAYGAMENMLTALDEAATGEDDLFVTVVPMGDTVNIGEARGGWVEGLVDDDRGYDDWGPDQKYNYMKEHHWNGCVFAREEPTPDNPYLLTDARPGDVPFGVMDHRLNNHAFEGHGSRRFDCPQEIIGPSTEIDEVLRSVNRITAAGTGRFDQGMAWGWRAVSANWHGQWGIQGYPTTDLEERRKVVVFISDGNSTMEEWRFDGHQDWGYNNAGRAMLGNLVDVCHQAKAQGIEVFTLYVEGNPHAESYMRACASTADHFFDVTRNEAMAEAFQAMGARLSDTRLVR
ncbi:MAG: VWA domain-containing protein [Hyphomicrobiales bacterium]